MAKAKKNIQSLQDSINLAKEQVLANCDKKDYIIPSIVDFVESPKYLGLSAYPEPVVLYPIQKIMLKVFYRGTVGNEDLKLTDEELEILHQSKLTDPVNGNVLDKYLSNNTFRELVLVWGRRCIAEDTEIVDPETGEVWTIGDLWNYGKTSISSWTYDEEQKTMREIANCNVIFQGERTVYTVDTASGHSIEVTGNQPLRTEEGWVVAEKIRVGTKIGFAPIVPIFGKSYLTQEEAAVLGYLSSSKFIANKNTISILTSQIEVVQDFYQKASVINPLSKIDKTSNLSYYLAFYPTGDQKCSYTVIEDEQSKPKKSLHSLITTNGLLNKSRKDKFVPKVIFTSAKPIIAAYLRSIFTSDAEIKYYDGITQFHCCIELSLPNEKMANDIRHLLHRFGIFATLKHNKDAGVNRYSLSFSRKQDIKIFANEIGSAEKEDTIEALVQHTKDIEGIDESRLIFSQIISIRKNGIKRTFDIQVSDIPHLQNFTANGFLVHNSGKDFEISLIALYEAMKLLEAPGGNPYSIYKLSGDVPLTILSIANSAPQAGIVYSQIREKLLRSAYFEDKYLADGITAESIFLLTPEDKKLNIKLAEKGLPLKKGSVQIRVGHSESNTLVGLDCFAILFDEIGLYKTTEGSSSGDALYNNLTPALKTYVREETVVDEYGVPVIDEKTGLPKKKKVYDGKVMCISTPRGEEGILYKLYKTADDVKHRLMCRLPTWIVNPNHTEESLRDDQPDMSPEKFMMEFGAEFSGTAGDNFFASEVVENCFRDKTRKIQMTGLPGYAYFAHLDPATTSHNYAMCICHKEIYYDEERETRDFRIVVDHLAYWTPKPGKPVNAEVIDQYVLKMNRMFYLYLVTYDQWRSEGSIKKLRNLGIPARETRFNRQYKNIIYTNLEQLAIGGRLILPEHHLLKAEMRNLQRKFGDNGFKIYPKKEGEVVTDDLVDALAGACYTAMSVVINKLPQGKLVNTPVSQGGNNIMWKSMQGTPMGFGSGQQVARQLDQRGKGTYYRR